jgi:hypothetical protein
MDKCKTNCEEESTPFCKLCNVHKQYPHILSLAGVKPKSFRMERQGGENRDYFLIKNKSFRATLDADGMFVKSALKKFTNNAIIEDHKLKPPKKIPHDSRPYKIVSER